MARGLWLLAFPLLTGAQSGDLPPDVLLLARIKVRMAENLERLPNYTCLETIERSRRSGRSRRYQLDDVVRLEVALVEGKELFSWPGAGKFEERDLRDLVPDGAISNGDFALHAKSVFQSPAVSYFYQGERIRENRLTHRFDYRVPQLMSGYKLRVEPHEGIAGYRGSFWVDAETLDLIRIEVSAEDIPPHVPLTGAETAIDYQRVAIGGADFLLPVSAEVSLIGLSGGESRNRITFSGCRQYTGESVLSFDAPAPAGVSPPAPPVRVVLPAGAAVDLALDHEIALAAAAVGDPVRATVARDIKHKGTLVFPKGAVATGRVARMGRLDGHSSYTVLGLEFTRIEHGSTFASAVLLLEDTPPATVPGQTVRSPRPAAPPNIGMLYVRGRQTKLPRGFRMSWRAASAPPDDQTK